MSEWEKSALFLIKFRFLEVVTTPSPPELHFLNQAQVKGNEMHANSIFIFEGFLYPIVAHWAWDGNGWLYKGVTYEDGGAITYQVSLS